MLWSLDRVHMGEVGFGLLTTASALGGMVGTFLYGRLELAWLLFAVFVVSGGALLAVIRRLWASDARTA